MMGLALSLQEDALQLSQVATGSRGWREVAKMALSSDAYRVLASQRVREWARRWRVPGLNHVLRMWQTGALGIEIGKDVTLSEGIYFIHPLGIVIGGDAKVGQRVKFFGNNTVGTAKDNGYPVIEDDVVVGAGARILGPVRVGARAVIGANAVVLSDIPPDSVAVGMPARVVKQRDGAAGDDGGVGVGVGAVVGDGAVRVGTEASDGAVV